jgi:hypothetical protein
MHKKQAEVDGHLRGSRIPPQRDLKARHRPLQLAAGAIRLAEVAVKGGLARRESDGTLDELDRLTRLASLEGQHAEQVQRIGIVGLACEDRLVNPLGQLPLAAPMMSHRFGQRWRRQRGHRFPLHDVHSYGSARQTLWPLDLAAQTADTSPYLRMNR